MDTQVAFLVLTFVISVTGMVAFVVALIQKQVLVPPEAALSIFSNKEAGEPEPDRSSEASLKWRALDRSARKPILFFLLSSVVWLLAGSLLGLLVSLKFHHPTLLDAYDFLSFGKVRTLHLNIIAYGWLSFAGLGLSLWLVPRITKVPLRGCAILTTAGCIWNVALILGCVGILYGYSDGLEWLEFWWPVDILMAIAGAMVAIPLFLTVLESKEEHLYVSMWYILAAFVWFPVLFVIANTPFLHMGAQQAIVNWWFAHNVLGLWVTPLGLSIVYYLLPKIIGRPIASYQLSLFGFWGLALFYSQVGGHHLIGSPLPTWLINLSIVMSIGMVIPVSTVAINHHVTAYRHFNVLRESVVLRFIVFGAMMYTLSSLQGCLHSSRTFNYVTHFTHWTVSHAHLGLYGFTTMVFFGGIYFAMPRLLDCDWTRPGLVNAHFWFASVGVITYVVTLGIGGVLQGLALRDASGTFQASLEVTRPYLLGRSLGGTLMFISHLLFAFNICSLLWVARWGRRETV